MSEFAERKFGDLTIKVDRQTCIATENCMEIAPEVFEMDEEGIVTFKKDAESIDRVRLLESCEICPVGALSVVDAEGNEIVPGS
jgi:ferredoxin